MGQEQVSPPFSHSYLSGVLTTSPNHLALPLAPTAPHRIRPRASFTLHSRALSTSQVLGAYDLMDRRRAR